MHREEILDDHFLVRRVPHPDHKPEWSKHWYAFNDSEEYPELNNFDDDELSVDWHVKQPTSSKDLARESRQRAEKHSWAWGFAHVECIRKIVADVKGEVVHVPRDKNPLHAHITGYKSDYLKMQLRKLFVFFRNDSLLREPVKSEINDQTNSTLN